MSEILRDDLLVISQLIEMNEKILDVGCGDGNLLEYLSKNKNADCRGIEIRRDRLNECVKKGLSLIQGDANYDLERFSPYRNFDEFLDAYVDFYNKKNKSEIVSSDCSIVGEDVILCNSKEEVIFKIDITSAKSHMI